MAVEVPPGVLDGVETGADVQRHVHTALSGNRSGVCGATDLAVSQSSTPGMTVAVAAGYALVAGSTVTHQGMYGFHNDAAVDVAISPGDPANPRNDIVCAQIRDASYAGVDSDARLFVVQGTPAAVPSDPALPASSLALARVRVDANESTSILTADITDLRAFAGDYRTDILEALKPTSSTSITSVPVGGAAAGIAVRIPIATGGSVVMVEFTVRNDKGSNLAAGDDLAVIPVGFRPALSTSNLSAQVINTNTVALVNISSAGLVEFASGTVATTHFIRVQATYAGT